MESVFTLLKNLTCKLIDFKATINSRTGIFACSTTNDRYAYLAMIHSMGEFVAF